MADDLQQTAAAAAMSAKPIKVRAEPRQESKIDDHYYMSKCDARVHDRLKAVENPKLADFERVFNESEQAFLCDPEMEPLYRMMLDDMDPPSKRMLMALHRYTQ